jgi:hypothetical protein
LIEPLESARQVLSEPPEDTVTLLNEFRVLVEALQLDGFVKSSEQGLE